MSTNNRYDQLVRRVREAVLGGDGATAASIRAAAEAKAARFGGRPGQPDAAAAEPLPEPVGAFVEKVALHAYRVTDGDVEALRSAGHSEDAVFELVVSAALGAGCGRLERGLAALRGEV